MDVLDILTSTGELKPVSQWPKVWRTTLSGLAIALVKSCAEVSNIQSDNAVLRSDNNLQTQVISTNAFNFNRFNQVAEHAIRINSQFDTSTEETVI